MTAVQAAALPLALAGDDLIAQAKTGSGKTAAYVLPLLQSLLDQRLEEGSLLGLAAYLRVWALAIVQNQDF